MNSNVLSTLTLPVWLFCFLGLTIFLSGVVFTVNIEFTKNRTEKTEFRVIAICLMMVGIGMLVAISTAKLIGLF